MARVGPDIITFSSTGLVRFLFEKIDSKSEGSASVIHVYCHLATEQWLQQRMLRFFLSTAAAAAEYVRGTSKKKPGAEKRIPQIITCDVTE